MRDKTPESAYARGMERGFTLIELMVVIALIGIVGSMALPAFNQMMQNNRRVAAVNDFLSSVHHARSEAITRNQRVSICPSSTLDGCAASGAGSWRTGWIVFRDANGDGSFDAGDVILTTGPGLRGNLELVSDDYADAITFTPSGRVVGAGGTLLLCESGNATAVRSILIDRTGRPRAVSAPGGDCS